MRKILQLRTVMPYDILKEKLICRTVRLVPEYLNIVDSVIAHHKESEKGFKEILFSSKDIVCKAFEASQTNNIRSLKCAIQDFERLYVSVAKFNLDIEIIQHFLAVFLAMIFEYKAGRLEHGHYGFIFADNEMRNKYSNFNSFYILETVREWIITGEWNQIGIDIEVNVLIQKLRKEEPKDILLRSFLMDINDEVLNVGYPMLLNESYEGLLTFDDYIQLIKIRLESRYFNIELPIEADIDKALRGMRLRIEKIKENKIEEPDGHSALGENDFNNVLPTEKDMLKEISLFRTYQQHIKNRNILVEALMKNDTKTIYDCFNKYLQSFDAQLAKTTYDYYNALNNPDRRSFSVEFSKQWISASHLTLTDRESSVNGFKLLKRSIFENSSQENIKKAIDKRFIENIDKLIESYNNYLNNCESDSELNPFDNVVIWNK